MTVLSLVARPTAGGNNRSALRAIFGFLRGASNPSARQCMLAFLIVKVVQELYRWIQRRRALRLGWMRVHGLADEIDSELIQGCLLSTENLLTLGRVEKRTLFTRPLREVLGGNEYLVQELISGATTCRRNSNNCMVTRWLKADERYHVLQACLNETSSIFGRNFVHCNALDHTHANDQFKSTWYCLTVTTPTRPGEKRQDAGAAKGKSNDTCTFTDMSRHPRGTIRVMIVNESEIRRIADGKLRAPSWGFFNNRHAERYRMLVDFARNFHAQLTKTPVEPSGSNSAIDGGDEAAGSMATGLHRPDGGMMRRVHSQPNLLTHPRLGGRPGALTLEAESKRVHDEGTDDSDWDAPRKTPSDGGAEDCCFLRLHIPHYVGSNHLGNSPGGHHDHHHNNKLPVPPAGLRHVRSTSAISMADAHHGGRVLGPAGPH